MNILLINCKKDADNSFQHTVYKISKLNGRQTKEIIFNHFFNVILEREFIPEFIKDPKAFIEKYT